MISYILSFYNIPTVDINREIIFIFKFKDIPHISNPSQSYETFPLTIVGDINKTYCGKN